MKSPFVRIGPLMDLYSYPHWLQQIVTDCSEARRSVVEHEIFRRMIAGTLPERAMQRFLIGLWPVIEQFPQYMAMNLLKVHYGVALGHDMARRYLIRNIRVEQNHGEYWIDWAGGHGVSRDELLFGWRSSAADALSHWCWHTCERDPLPAAMAATNYAIEGPTGEWAAAVCNSSNYPSVFASDVRKKAMMWLRMHAQYDDSHPWEALDIIATLLGAEASSQEIAGIRAGILRSCEYMRMAFDDCLSERGMVAYHPEASGYPASRQAFMPPSSAIAR